MNGDLTSTTAVNGNSSGVRLDGRSAQPPSHDPMPSGRGKLARFLKVRRKGLGLTQQSLAKKLGVRASHVALLENGRRRPSLGLLVRLAAALGADGRELLVLAYPESKGLLETGRARPTKLNPIWRRLLNDPALLARYQVTHRELEALRQLGLLGGKVTVKGLLAILMLVREAP
jgi:transcriptional regulator with XRE-family HTH domain